MPALYLTPSSISYLTQLLLTLLITIYLASRFFGRAKKSALRQDGELLVVFISLTVLSLCFFIDYSSLPSERLPVAFCEPVAVAILLIALIQFAYDFPVPNKKDRIERWLALAVSCFYLYRELQAALYRFERLPVGQVVFRGQDLNTLMTIEFAWVIFVFGRNALRNWKLPATRNFALIMLLPLGLAIMTYYRGIHPQITLWYPIVSSIGLLLTVFLFTLNYLTSQPERVSFVIKISGAMLTSLLAVFGLVAWLVAPAYADHYESPIAKLDQRTLRFNPDGQNGYVVDEIPFQWDENYDRVLKPDSDKINFDFPFFGQSYSAVYVGKFGSIGMSDQYWGHFQYHFSTAALIFPLLVNLNEFNHPDGDFYVSQTDGRLVITVYNIPAQYHPEARYTFQVVLYTDGRFDLSYNGLPDLKFYADGQPEEQAVWAIGVKPAGLTSGTASFTSLPLHIGPQGALLDEYRSFRVYLHNFLASLASAVVVSSFAFLAGAALILNHGLARPLNSLLKGVQNYNKGQRDRVIPVQSNDEIGFLTESFNTMGGELNTLISSLEQRVVERTQDLALANDQLRSEMDARAAAQAQVVEQQRAVATLEERERLARALHDGIGQVLGFLNVQAQSANDSIRAGDKESASRLLRRMEEVAQEAHDDVRGYILGLKQEPAAARSDFLAQLDRYRQYLFHSFGFQVQLNLPPELPAMLLSTTAETQLFYIVREALNNACAHSGQKEAEVTITFDETQVHIVIEDRGRGIATRERAGHFGLGIMRERAEQVGGSLQIESAPDSGTRVTAHVPRERAAESLLGQRVLLVDDHPLFLEGMANLLAGRGLTVIGTASDGWEALAKARSLCPAVILMDIEMPRCDGLEATRLIKAERPEVKIVMLTVSGEERHLFEALQSGASGYLLKSLEAAELTSLLEELLRGEVSLSPGLANKMLEAFTRHKSPLAQAPGVHPRPEEKATQTPAHVELTERQMEVLRLVAQGLMYKEVAAQLGLAEVTVKYHMGEILARLHLNNRREAVRYWQEGK